MRILGSLARWRYRRLLCRLGWAYLQAVARDAASVGLGDDAERLAPDSRSRFRFGRSSPSVTRELDFPGLLSELAALMGQRVRIESAVDFRRPFHFSLGTLAGSLDGLDDAARPTQLMLYLEGYEAGFILRQGEVDRAAAYTLELEDGSYRALEVELRGGGHLRVEHEAMSLPSDPSEG